MRINALLVHIVVPIPLYIVGCGEPSRGASRERLRRLDLSRSAHKRNSSTHCGTHSGAYLIGLKTWFVKDLLVGLPVHSLGARTLLNDFFVRGLPAVVVDERQQHLLFRLPTGNT